MPWSINYSRETRKVNVNLFGGFTEKDSSSLITALNQDIFRRKSRNGRRDREKVRVTFRVMDSLRHSAIFELMDFITDYKSAVLLDTIGWNSGFYGDLHPGCGCRYKVKVKNETGIR